MSLFSTRGVNVKLAQRDDEEKLPYEERYRRAQDRVELASAYSAVVQDFVTGVASTVVAASVTIIAAKFASNFLTTAISKIK